MRSCRQTTLDRHHQPRLAGSEASCVVLWSTSAPRSHLRYTLTFPSGTQQVYAADADAHGDALHVVPISYLPPPSARQVVLVTVSAVGPPVRDGHTRFAVVHPPPIRNP